MSLLGLNGRPLSLGGVYGDGGGGGGGNQRFETFDLRGADDFPRPYKSRQVRDDSGGTVREVDLAERRGYLAGKRGRGQVTALFSPTVIFEEEYGRLVERGFSDDEAASRALQHAQATVERAMNVSAKHAGFKSYVELQNLMQRIEARNREVEKMSSGFPIPIGASGHQATPQRLPQGVRTSGLNRSPNANNPLLRNAGTTVNPDNASAVDYLRFKSVSGKVITFEKKINGVPKQGLSNLINLLCQIERALQGGPELAVLVAAGVRLVDDTGTIVFDAGEYAQNTTGVKEAPADPDQPEGLEFA